MTTRYSSATSVSAKAARPRGRLGRRIDKLLLMFYGPADLGDRGTQAPPPADVDCALCGRPMSEHTFIQAAQNRRRVQCPDPTAPTVTP